MKLNTKRHTSFYLSFGLPGRIIIIGMISLCLFVSCHNRRVAPPKEIVNTPEQMRETVPEVIGDLLAQVAGSSGKLDSDLIRQPEILQYLYDKSDHAANWSTDGHWTATGDSLAEFISQSKLYGLFPEDYHFNKISYIRNAFISDSLARKDAVLWSKADLLLTDALMQIVHDVKLGRLQKDSITLRKDSALTKEFYEDQLEKIIQSRTVGRIISMLEPTIPAYQELKERIPAFLDSARFNTYTYIPYPNYDSTDLRPLLARRFFEEGLLDSSFASADSLQLAHAVRRYQEKKKLKADGKAGGETIRSLNLTDKDKFVRIALSLDKYKMLPAELPEKYLWVNLAGFYLQLREDDTVRIFSKVVVGKPLTRTPELNSAVSEMITYPQWSVPQSIIAKEFLPALKKNPGYLQKKGFSLLNGKNEEVDPYFVDWSKYKTSIPFRIVQGSGDDNALGIMKFNFPNKYAVYLHDTNQRYLFAQAVRALSHGCVRVQEWQKLTNYILQNDSAHVKLSGNNSFTKADSVTQWLTRKEKHFVPVRDKIPLFIRYFTCEAKDGGIIFYDDIYNEDQMLRERYFAGK